MTEEEKEMELQWQRLLFKLRPNLGKKPSMEGLLFLIGVQEFGRFGDFSKEEKEDLMHIAVCTLMGNAGYYEFQGRDEDDWPHFTRSEKVMPEGLEVQEKILKQQILKYFEDREE